MKKPVKVSVVVPLFNEGGAIAHLIGEIDQEMKALKVTYEILVVDDAPDIVEVLAWCLTTADYEMIGVLGRVTSPVRENGTGEMIFSQEGRRRGVAVRCDGGGPIPKDAEVVVTRYERGIAYVKQWDQLTGL